MWRLQKEGLRGPRLLIEKQGREIVFIKGGLRRSVEMSDGAGLWKTLTNDLEFFEEAAIKILELVAAETSVPFGEAP